MIRDTDRQEQGPSGAHTAGSPREMRMGNTPSSETGVGCQRREHGGGPAGCVEHGDPRVLLATATYRCGVLLAPLLADLVADEITEPGSLAAHPYRVDRPMPMEIDREGDDFAKLDRYRGVVDGAAVATPELIEFMRVGVMGQLGAAEYATLRLGSGEQTVCATHNPNPPADQPSVLYDDGVPQYFPPTTVVPLADVRSLMIDFALIGHWSEAVCWKDHDNLVG